MTTRTLRTLFHALLAGFVALALAAPAAAADPPGRVGRIAWMSGTVQLRNADTGEWNTAVRNYPLTNGDALSTGPGARLEIGIGSTTVRLDSSSELSIDQIDDDRVRLYLTNGSATVRVRSRESAREFELATRDGRFTTQDVGAFRFDHAQNVSSATPYLGTLHFTAEDSELDIPNGKRAQFWYSGSTAYSFSSPERDDFSEWSIGRDQRQDTRSTRRYVSQEMTGYEDLAGHGDWYDSTDYGPVWYPSVVAAGWAPYRTGHWAWVSPWGWTWIDDAPWGFAPFHYGRWVWHRDRWGWAPGRHVARPVYAPALVAWIGTPSVTVRVAGGPSVGWFPLAPREVYVPGYRCSPTYVRNVNITHVTHIENVTQIINEPHRVMERTRFTNRHLPQAVTVVASDVVTQRRPVAPAVEHGRNPRFLEAISRQPSLAHAPVAAPALPPRVDANRQERERRGDNPRDRRPDGERPPHERPHERPNERRFTAPGAVPLPAPVNANAVPAVVPQTHALPPPDNRRGRGEAPRDAQARPPENGPNANPRFNRPPPQAPAATAPGGAPAAAVTAPPASQPASQPVPPPASAPLPNARRPAVEPPGEHRRRPEPTPSADTRSDRPASPAPGNLPAVVAPSAPAPSAAPPPVPDNRRATPEAPPNANPRFNRPPTPTPAVAPAAPAPAIPASVAPPVEPPRASQPLPPSRRAPGEPPAGEPRRAIDPPPHANPRADRPPQAMPPPPAAMPQPVPAQPPRRTEQREQHSPPPTPRAVLRSEPMPAAPHPPAPPPQRSQPMPPREAPPAPPPQAQHPRSAERMPPPPATVQGTPPPNNPRHRDDGDRRIPGNRDEGNRGRE